MSNAKQIHEQLINTEQSTRRNMTEEKTSFVTKELFIFRTETNSKIYVIRTNQKHFHLNLFQQTLYMFLID